MTPREALGKVPWLAPLGEAVADEVAAASARVVFPPGRPIVVELEPGDEMFVLVEGTARVTVSGGAARPREVGVLGPGDACGETSLLTRQLRSATVTADTEVVALRIGRRAFETLLARHPAIAAHFARVVAARLVDTRDELDALLGGRDDAPPSAAGQLAGRSSAVVPARGSVRRAWRELVVAERRAPAVLALAAFLVAIVAVRAAAWAVAAAGAPLFGFLRAAYVAGFALLFVSTAASLARFRPSWHRVVAVALGAGFALVLNELSVFLAFDVFYLDMTTPDPSLAFSVEALYRRSESVWAVSLMLVFLVQLVLLRRFWRRVALVVRTRIGRLGA